MVEYCPGPSGCMCGELHFGCDWEDHLIFSSSCSWLFWSLFYRFVDRICLVQVRQHWSIFLFLDHGWSCILSSSRRSPRKRPLSGKSWAVGMDSCFLMWTCCRSRRRWIFCWGRWSCYRSRAPCGPAFGRRSGRPLGRSRAAWSGSCWGVSGRSTGRELRIALINKISILVLSNINYRKMMMGDLIIVCMHIDHKVSLDTLAQPFCTMPGNSVDFLFLSYNMPHPLAVYHSLILCLASLLQI